LPLLHFYEIFTDFPDLTESCRDSQAQILLVEKLHNRRMIRFLQGLKTELKAGGK
jgi:hypothetical protein